LVGSYLKIETEFSLRNVVIINGRMMDNDHEEYSCILGSIYSRRARRTNMEEDYSLLGCDTMQYSKQESMCCLHLHGERTRCYVSTIHHRNASQKAVNLILTTVRTSNLVSGVEQSGTAMAVTVASNLSEHQNMSAKYQLILTQQNLQQPKEDNAL
jgi:hypothetical protein